MHKKVNTDIKGKPNSIAEDDNNLDYGVMPDIWPTPYHWPSCWIITISRTYSAITYVFPNVRNHLTYKRVRWMLKRMRERNRKESLKLGQKINIVESQVIFNSSRTRKDARNYREKKTKTNEEIKQKRWMSLKVALKINIMERKVNLTVDIRRKDDQSYNK